VADVTPEQWNAPTPCSDWDVRQLVRHVAYETLWVPALMDGLTLEAVGDRFEGDVLGEDPKAAWAPAAAAAIRAVLRGDLSRTVHVSFGEIPAEEYVFEIMLDLVVHGWDLARATGADEGMDPEAVEFCYRRAEPSEEALKRTGLFGPKVVPPPGADLQTKLLAILGRVA